MNASSETQPGQAGHETIYSSSVDQIKTEPIIISNPAKDSDHGLLVLWKFPVVLSRPSRLRLQSPSVVFALAAHLKTAVQLQARIRDKEYLPSQMPSGINLLESFNSDPALGTVKPRLSALRVTAVKPASLEEDSTRLLKIKSPRSLRIIPAFQVRSRYLRPHSTPIDTSILASLDVEATPWAGDSISITSVEFNLPDGIVEDLNESLHFTFPMDMLPRDDLTLLYRLSRSPLEQVPIAQKPLHIAVNATVHVSQTCTPKVSMLWSTSADFSQPVDPAAERDRRPSQPVIPSNLAFTKPDALPSFEITTRHMRSLSVDGFGITMTFTAPPDRVAVGEMFTWTIFVVNRSDHPRKLALLPIPKRKAPSSHDRALTNRPLSTSYNRKSREAGRAVDDVADAVLDENVLYAAQKAAALEGTGVICYSTDVRVGPLAPNACQTTEFRFMALKAGLLGLEAVRVVDLGTQEHVDVKDLPSIVVASP